MLKKYPTLLFILHRSVWYFLTFIVAITINFFLPRFGADPIELIMSKQKGLNDQQAREKEASYLREFGLVETIELAATEEGALLVDSKGNPLSIKEMKAKNLLTLEEQKSLWNSSVTITDTALLQESLKALLASGKKIEGYDPASAEVIVDGDAFVASLQTALSIEEVKALKGLSFEGESPIYTINVAQLKAAYGNSITSHEVTEETVRPYVVRENGNFELYAYTGGKAMIPAKLPTTIEVEGATVDITVAPEVINQLAKDGSKTVIKPVKTPLVKQYFKYLWMVLHGDLGTSFVKYPKKVNAIVAEAIPWTLALQFPTIVFGWIVGNLLGALAAYKRGLFDKVLFPMALLTNSIPFFAVGMLLVYLFAETINIFPSSGGYAIDVIPGFTWAFISSAAYFYVLPFLSIFPVLASGQATGMRTMGIYELGTGYVKYAKTLGIKENKILMYIFRNAMLPQLTGLALMLGVMIGGALITEMIFSYPGLGMALLSATQNNDYPLIQGAALLVTITVLIANFSVDILIGFFDPRVKAGRMGA